MTLTPRQRAVLKSLAHGLKPLTQIGKDGVTTTVVKAVEDALKTRELLKVRVLETAPGTAQEMGDAVAAQIEDAHLIQVIGRTLVIYRRHPENPVIQLPGA